VQDVVPDCNRVAATQVDNVEVMKSVKLPCVHRLVDVTELQTREAPSKRSLRGGESLVTDAGLRRDSGDWRIRTRTLHQVDDRLIGRRREIARQDESRHVSCCSLPQVVVSAA
jgi:hypothetical protein